METAKIKPHLLLILDGFGLSDNSSFNAIANAHTPNFDRLIKNNPHCSLQAGGECVGLPDNQMGNSEVGHLSIGAGRKIPQSLTAIKQEIANDGAKLQRNPTWQKLIQQAKLNNRLHLWGLVSDGGVHSHRDHIVGFIKAAKQQGIGQVYMHAVLDGRDTAPNCAGESLKIIEKTLAECDYAPIVDVTGRYLVMDRDNNWDRVKQAWDMYIQPSSTTRSPTSEAALEHAYAEGISDEFVPCYAMPHAQAVADDDVWLFCNFRSDRARQITRAMLPAQKPAFDGFDNADLPNINVFTVTAYSSAFDCDFLFQQNIPKNTLGEIIANQQFKQFRIAETEKYAHVTYFFNGGNEQVLPGEQRSLVPSPKVKTYDLQPEMSAFEVTKQLCKAIESQEYAFLLCNLANGDMVGHTGNYQAAIKAVEVIDQCIGNVLAALSAADGSMILTADHGNCEQMLDYDTSAKHTAHTQNLVPCIFSGPNANQVKVTTASGNLADIAPTLLHLMDLPPEPLMQGNILFSASQRH